MAGCSQKATNSSVRRMWRSKACSMFLQYRASDFLASSSQNSIVRVRRPRVDCSLKSKNAAAAQAGDRVTAPTGFYTVFPNHRDFAGPKSGTFLPDFAIMMLPGLRS